MPSTLASAVTVRGLDEVDAARWDARVLELPGGGFSQTTLYARYVWRARPGREPLFVRWRVDGRPAAQLLAFRDAARRQLSWKGGPLIAAQGEALPRAAAAVAAWVAGTGLVLKPSTLPAPAGVQAKAVAAALAAAGAQVAAAGTLHVRLDAGMEARMDRSVAKNVRRCRERGVEVVTTRALLERGWSAERVAGAYAGLIGQTLARNGAAGHDARAAAAAILEQDLEGSSLTFFGCLGHEPLAALNVVVAGDTASERKQAYGERCRELGLQVNDAVKAAAMEWARRQGLAVFDLMGISLDASPRAQGIARYKSKFGGDFQPTLELRHPAP